MSASTLFTLAAILQLDKSNYDKGLSDAEAGANTAGSKIGRAFSTMGNGFKTIAKVGMTAVTAATGAMVAFGKSSVEAGGDFDKSMSQVAATMGKTTDEIKDLRDFAQQMGSTTAFSATQSADALNYMALAGYDAETSMKMLPNVLNLAAAGNMELAEASDMVTDTQSALGLTLEETTYLVDKMAKTSSKSNTSVQQLGAAMLQVGGTAKMLKGGTTELSAALGILADNGTKGAEGGTALRNVLLSMSSSKFENTFGKLGVSAYDANGNMRELKDILADMNKVMGDMSEQEKTALITKTFNKADLKNVNALLATTTDRWDYLTEEIIASSGAAKEMANTQLDNLQGDVTLFKSALEGAKIAVSDQLTPSLREFVQFGTDGLSKMTEAFKTGGIEGAMEEFGNILSNGLNKVIEKLPDFVDAGIKLLGALGKGLLDNMPIITQAVVKVLSQVGKAIINALPQLVQAVGSIIKELVKVIKDSIPLLMEGLKTIASSIMEMLPELVSMATEIIMALVQAIIDMFPEIVDTGIQMIGSLLEGITDALPTLLEALPELILTIANAITDNLPQIVEIGLKLIVSLADGILKALPDLIKTIPVIIENLIQAIVDCIPLIIDAGVQLLTSLVLNLPAIIVEVVKAIPQIIASLVKGILQGVGQIAKAGFELLKGLVGRITEATSSIVSNIPKVISSIISAFANAPAKMAEVGSNLIKGLWNGILNVKDWLLKKIKSFAGNVLDGIKGFFGIHSPSKVFENEVGKMLGLGMAIGIEDSEGDVEDAMEGLMQIPNAASFDDININSNVTSSASVKGASIAGIYGLLQQVVEMLPGLSDNSIVLDTGALVGQTVGAYNQALGDLMFAEGRSI